MSLEETISRLLSASGRTEDLLALINDLYAQENNAEDKVLIEALIKLHNSRDIDFVALVRVVDKNSCEYDLYTILRVFESALPSLDASVEDVLNCLVNLMQQVASFGIYGAFECFCSMEENRPRDSVKFIMAQSEIDSYVIFLTSSILAYDSYHVTEAIQMIENLITNSNNVVRSQAYFTLGRLRVDDAQARVIWEMLKNSDINEHGSDCSASILRAMLNFGEKFPHYWLEIEGVLITLVKGASPEVLNETSKIVAFQKMSIPDGIFTILVKQLANVNPEHKYILDNIDHLLVQLVESGRSPLAVELLESLLIAGVEFKVFDYFSNKLLREYQGLLNNIITKWLLSGESLLCRGILGVFDGAAEKDIEIKAEMALLNTEVKKLFVGRKAVGWLFTRPVTVASFIISVSEVASITTVQELESILYDPLLLSYPGELKRFLQSCIDKGIQEHLCERLLGKLKSYHADIEKISKLNELKASSENVRIYWKDFDKSMQKAHEEASKSSFIRMIAKTQVLLYGNSSIYYVHQGDGKSVRQEMQMHSFSHSTEMPRLSVLAPESLDYVLRVYRCERIINEVNS